MIGRAIGGKDRHRADPGGLLTDQSRAPAIQGMGLAVLIFQRVGKFRPEFAAHRPDQQNCCRGLSARQRHDRRGDPTLRNRFRQLKAAAQPQPLRLEKASQRPITHRGRARLLRYIPSLLSYIQCPTPPLLGLETVATPETASNLPANFQQAARRRRQARRLAGSSPPADL